MISYEYRMKTLLQADGEHLLDITHCDQCAEWGNPGNPWRAAPNTRQGRAQLIAMGDHFLAHDIGRDYYSARKEQQ